MVKNYIKLFFIIAVTVIITIIIHNLYRVYEDNQKNSSYIAKYVSTMNYSELKNTVSELNTNSFIYLSYRGNKNIYDFEKKLKKILRQYELEDNFIFVDCSDYLNSENKLSVEDKTIVLPAIIYYKDNMPIDYIDSKERSLTTGDFSQLLDKYEIEGNA